MYEHHKATLQKIVNKFEMQQEVLAILLTGSIAHGYAKPNSDIDILIIVEAEDYQKRKTKGQLTYFDDKLAEYEGGYVDGKYISLDFLKLVGEKGSEPARHAFSGAQIQFSRVDNLEELLQQATAYPKKEKREKIESFYAQMQAWRWYCHEAIKHENDYLLNYSKSQLILFGGRLILAHNEILFPYHKWLLKTIKKAPEKPEGIAEAIDSLLNSTNSESIDGFTKKIEEFQNWEVQDEHWPNLFARDSELNWIDQKPPVGDM